MTNEQRERVGRDAKGKTIESMDFIREAAGGGDSAGERGHWIISFTDGTDMAVRLLADEWKPLPAVNATEFFLRGPVTCIGGGGAGGSGRTATTTKE